MSLQQNAEICIGNEKLQNIEETIYLRQLISLKNEFKEK